jgi:hypothetical protein
MVNATSSSSKTATQRAPAKAAPPMTVAEWLMSVAARGVQTSVDTSRAPLYAL